MINEVPIEAQIEVQEQYDTEVAYMKQKNAKTYKKYLNLSSNLRIVADKLDEMFHADPLRSINYEDFANELSMKVNVVKNIIGELATWEGWLLVIVSSPKKKGCFQLYSKDLMTTKRWIIQNQRYLATKDQRIKKTTVAYDIKRNSIKKNHRIRNLLGIKQKGKNESKENN